MSDLISQMESDQTNLIDKTDNLKKLSTEVKKLQEKEKEIKSAEDALKRLKVEHEQISGEIIPDLLTEMGLTSLKLADGSAVDVRMFYGATIPKDEGRREAAFNWLRQNGLGDLIKNEVSVSFGKDEDTKALQNADLAQRQGYQPLQKLKVEPSTLRALVRERLENGKEMPMDLFNVFVGNRTKITKS